MDTGSNRRDTRAKPVELKTTRMSLLVAGKIAGSGMVEVDRSAFNPCLHTKPADALSRRQSLATPARKWGHRQIPNIAAKY
ncbi:uncharacterized protein An07g02940 [Aspergillus niger]|uniref:Contig An07c0080, genomic contig n=2 Tax=Aspergillus niger TaxID=5061 RepID=A2QMQ4_ASPNC|nr:uncharacterized protein An07g02940 [Aspergillus niger]CAL00228.1 unnamed protein product [Aspergillus niger]